MRTPEPEDPVPTGGFLVDMASHDYDAACWFLAQEPVEASAARQLSVFPELEALGDLDNAAVTVRFDGGGIASLHISRTCPWGHDVRAEVVGDEGSVLIGNAGSQPGVTVMTRKDAEGFPQDYRELFTDAYVAELAAFVAACRGEGPAGPSLEDDRRAVAIGVAARASAVAGRPLEVGPDWPWPEQVSDTASVAQLPPDLSRCLTPHLLLKSKAKAVSDTDFASGSRSSYGAVSDTFTTWRLRSSTARTASRSSTDTATRSCSIDRPAGEAVELGENGGEVDGALAEWAEEAVLPRLLDRQLPGADTRELGRGRRPSGGGARCGRGR